MESVGIIVFVVIVFLVILLVASASSPRKQYEKEFEKRTGIDKLSLMISKDSIYFGNRFKEQDDDPLWFAVNLSVISAHQTLSGSFYSLLKGASESFGNLEFFDELSDESSSNDNLRLLISSKVFGLSFGIVIKRIADSTKVKIKRPMIKKFIDSCDFEEEHKKEIVKMATTYLGLEASDTETRWTSLEKMTYALVGAIIERDKDEVADPMMIMPIKTALGLAYDKVDFDDTAIKELEKQGIIESSETS